MHFAVQGVREWVVPQKSLKGLLVALGSEEDLALGPSQLGVFLVATQKKKA